MRIARSVAAGVTMASVVLAPAGMAAAQPVAPGNALQTIGLLEAEGYDVVIDRVGRLPSASASSPAFAILRRLPGRFGSAMTTTASS